MKKWFLSKGLLLALAYVSQTSVAHEYAPGIHEWKVHNGTLTLISSLLTNGMSLYSHNYNFYFRKNSDKDWYHVPFLENAKPGQYELNITTKAKDDRMVRDVRVEIRNNEILLLRARSTRDNEFEDSPIIVTRYRLVVTDGEDWPYMFKSTSSKTYPAKKDTGVDNVLAHEAKQLK